MNRPIVSRVLIATVLTILAVCGGNANAGDWQWLDPLHLFCGSPVDVHRPEACKQCGHEGCIERLPVEECAKGEKKVSKTSIHRQYYVVPEVRYKWEMRCVEKEVPAEYCKTVCDTQKVDHPYEVEHWQKYDQPCGGELHCKTCEPRSEQLECKTCKTEKAKTTIKVHYWSCVKVPYTVYRQVEKEVCVKQPRYVKEEVPVTKYVCEHCGGKGCGHCCRQ